MSVASTQKPKTRSEQKREAILQAAKQAFQEHGVQNTSMDKLAALANVSKRTVYNHFESKEALVLHLLTDLWQRALQDVGIQYDSQQPLAEQLERLLLAELEMISSSEYQEMTRVAIGHYFYQPEGLAKEMVKFSKQETALARWLEAAVADGKLKPLEVSLALGQLHNLIKGNAFWPQLMKMAPALTPEQQQALARETAGMFLSHYGVA